MTRKVETFDLGDLADAADEQPDADHDLSTFIEQSLARGGSGTKTAVFFDIETGPRPLAEIEADIKKLEAEILDLLPEVAS